MQTYLILYYYIFHKHINGSFSPDNQPVVGDTEWENSTF